MQIVFVLRDDETEAYHFFPAISFHCRLEAETKEGEGRGGEGVLSEDCLRSIMQI